MKTFIVDWGKESNGGRYALIQSTSLTNAWLEVDSVGTPKGIKELKIKMNYNDIRYMEFDAVDEPYSGYQVDKATNNAWYDVDDMVEKFN